MMYKGSCIPHLTVVGEEHGPSSAQRSIEVFVRGGSRCGYSGGGEYVK